MRVAWALPLLLTACVGAPRPPSFAGAAPTFDPLTFFAGRTEGNGVLHVILSHARTVRVHGSGEVLSDGSLRLVQTVEEQGSPAKRREWLIRRVSPGHYAGSLTDADGPVVVDADGSRLRIRFRMAHGLSAEQGLSLRPDGQAARNRLTVRKFGVVLATLDEQIVRGF